MQVRARGGSGAHGRHTTGYAEAREKNRVLSKFKTGNGISR